jgi:hypothetical protein
VIISNDFESSILYETDTRVACPEINTNAGHRHCISVVHVRLLVLSASCLHQNQYKEAQEIVDNIPCRALAPVP